MMHLRFAFVDRDSTETQMMRHAARRLWADESGQNLAEYALLLVLLALATLAAVRLLGVTIGDFFGISNSLRTA
jgi:Flp pilus assembly pilin Flp